MGGRSTGSRRPGSESSTTGCAATASLFQYRDEGLLRLFFSDLTDPETALDNVRRMREWREQAVAFFRSQFEPHAQEDVDLGYRFPLRALEFGIAWLEAQAEWLAELEAELTAR